MEFLQIDASTRHAVQETGNLPCLFICPFSFYINFCLCVCLFSFNCGFCPYMIICHVLPTFFSHLFYVYLNWRALVCCSVDAKINFCDEKSDAPFCKIDFCNEETDELFVGLVFLMKKVMPFLCSSEFMHTQWLMIFYSLQNSNFWLLFGRWCSWNPLDSLANMSSRFLINNFLSYTVDFLLGGLGLWS